MPKRKERMAGYIRESDPGLAESVTIDSQAKAIREYAHHEGYIYEPQHEYKEAISAYMVPYYERPRMRELLKAAERHEFDVVVVTEVRALSRKGAGEASIIYDTLKKYGIRLETVKQKFEDDETGQMLFVFEAQFASMERQRSYLRMQRGKKDRQEISHAPNGHPHPAYGYILLDTDREVKGRYEFNHTIMYVDEEGREWSEYSVCQFIIALVVKRWSLRSIATRLNDMGIPPPHSNRKRKLVPHWDSSALYRILSNPIYKGEVWGGRYKKVNGTLKRVPKEEWVYICEAPAMMDKQTWEEMMMQFAHNKQDALRNNHHTGEEIGLLRSGYVFCGICGCKMHVQQPGPALKKRGGTAFYRCHKKPGTNHALNHLTLIHIPHLDNAAWEKVKEVLKNPEEIRARVHELRMTNRAKIDPKAITDRIEEITKQMENLFELGKHATTQAAIGHLGAIMQDLERQRREAEAMMYVYEEEEEERKKVEAEIARFESWVDQVKGDLLQSDYLPSYAEKRLAIHILGLRCTVYPTKGDYPYRYQIEVTVPRIMATIQNIVLQSTAG